MKKQTNEKARRTKERGVLEKRLDELYDINPKSDAEAARVDRQIDAIEKQLCDLNPQGETDKLFATEAEWEAVGSNDEDEQPRRTRPAKPKRAKPGNASPFSGPTKTPYGTCPLPILAIMHGKDVHGRQAFQRAAPEDRKAFCAFVRAYSIVHVARFLRRSTRTDIMKMQLPETPPKGFDRDNRKHRAIGAAMVWLGREGGNLNRIEQHWQRGQRLMKEHDLAETDQAHFRISLALLDSQYEFLSLRDLRVLCAVNSCFEEGWGTINLEVLSWRAVGAWSKERLALLGVRPLTEKQVRVALDTLQAHHLIQRLLVGRRTYAAKGSMSKTAFRTLVADHYFKNRAERAVPTRDGKLRVLDRVAD